LNCAAGLTASHISHKEQRKGMGREIEKAGCSTAHTEIVIFKMKPKHGAVWASDTCSQEEVIVEFWSVET